MRPAKENAPVTVGAARGGEFSKSDSPDFAASSLSEQALETIEGERLAHEYLDRLRAQHVTAESLAACVAGLQGAALTGFCAVLRKSLKVRL
jgi:hypothetical protein